MNSKVNEKTKKNKTIYYNSQDHSKYWESSTLQTYESTTQSDQDNRWSDNHRHNLQDYQLTIQDSQSKTFGSESESKQKKKFHWFFFSKQKKKWFFFLL